MCPAKVHRWECKHIQAVLVIQRCIVKDNVKHVGMCKTPWQFICHFTFSIFSCRVERNQPQVEVETVTDHVALVAKKLVNAFTSPEKTYG